MAKKLNSMPDFTARMSRNPHDLSQSTAYTCSTAQINPVYYHMLHAGDKLYFRGSQFTRMNPLMVASLAKIDVHIDYFFVPLSVMFTPSTSMFYQTDDLISSVFDKSLAGNSIKINRFPIVNLDSYLISNRGEWNGGQRMNAFNVSSSSEDSVFFDPRVFDCYGKSVARFLNFFDYSLRPMFEGSGDNPSSTPWFACAYQAVYQNYYRNDDREPKDYMYNLDKFYDINTLSYNDEEGAFNYDVLNRLFTMRYRSAYKDYFLSAKVNPIGSSVSMLNGSDSYKYLGLVQQWLVSNSNNPLYGSENINGRVVDKIGTPRDFSFNDVTSDSNYPSTFGGVSGGTTEFTAQGIRILFALDKLIRVTGRAEKNYESQFLAHFGVKIPHDVLHNITHIGHDQSTISPEVILSAADTFNSETGSGTALGAVGGQGQLSFSGKSRSFTAPCHGVFLALTSFVPRFRYAAGVNKLHDLSNPQLFWQPEFDRKGMQPIFEYEANPASNMDSRRIGWQFAYEQFKRKFDRVLGAFTLISQDEYEVESVNTYFPWVLSRRPFHTPSGKFQGYEADVYDFTTFLSTPVDLNGIMQVPYSTAWSSQFNYSNRHLIWHTDPFINDFHMEMKIVNFMSEFGEPEL